jgi:hypothetical protein
MIAMIMSNDEISTVARSAIVQMPEKFYDGDVTAVLAAIAANLTQGKNGPDNAAAMRVLDMAARFIATNPEAKIVYQQ